MLGVCIGPCLNVSTRDDSVSAGLGYQSVMTRDAAWCPGVDIVTTMTTPRA